MGLELVTLNPQLALRYQFPESMQGALIVAVDPESPLSQVCQPQRRDLQDQRPADPVGRGRRRSSINERAEHDRLIISLDRRGRGAGSSVTRSGCLDEPAIRSPWHSSGSRPGIRSRPRSARTRSGQILDGEAPEAADRRLPDGPAPQGRDRRRARWARSGRSASG